MPLLLLLLSIHISSVIGSNNNASATTLNRTASTTAAIRVKSTCSMTATIEPGEEHAAIMINGQYKESIGKTTVATFCNDPNGYAIYAIGYTGGDAGITGGYNTVLRSSALGPTYDIPTNTYESGDTSGWAMKLASVPGTYEPTILSDDDGPYSDYHTVPQSYTKVADFSSSTDATTGSSLNTTYSAYIRPTQPAGTYEGQVKYVLVHPSIIDTNHYYMQDVESWGSLLAVGQEVTAYDNRDDKSYTVRRMCMSGTGSTWQEKEANCTSSMLWMTQNLDLDLNKNVELTSENTDLNVIEKKNSGGIYEDGQGYRQDLDIIYWKPYDTTNTNINTANGAFTHWRGGSADPDGGDPDNSWYATGEVYNSNLCYVSSNDQTCNYLNANNTVAPNYFSHAPFTNNGSHGKIGNYYDYGTAIASSAAWLGFFGYGDTIDDVTKSPQNSICPKGWRLPRISSNAQLADFGRLRNVYSSDSNDGIGLISAPVYMVRAGLIRLAVLHYSGYSGFYWSSTIHDENNAYNLSFRSDNAIYGGGGDIGRLLSVRCVSDY